MSILVGTGRYWWIVVGPGEFGWHTAFGTSPFAPDIHSPIRRLGGCWEDAAGEVTGGIIMVCRPWLAILAYSNIYGLRLKRSRGVSSKTFF